MGKRSNMLVAVGLVVFLLGGAIVMLALRNDGGGDTAVAAANTADTRTVLVAGDDLAAGASGSDLVSSGKVRTQTANAAAPDAVTSPADLVGKVLALPVKKGEVIRLGSLRAETIKIPDGKQAVAVQVDFIPGVAGQVGPGDLVNLYAVVAHSTDPKQTVPFTKLLLGNVEILKVSDAPPPAAPTTPTTVNPLAAPVAASGTPQVFLVAVDQAQAEKLIFSASNQKLYASLVPKGQQPAPTAGANDANLFG